MNFKPKDLLNSDKFTKDIPLNEIQFHDGIKNNISISISYDKGIGYSTYIHIEFLKKNGFSVFSRTFMPMDSLMIRLTICNRKSKSALYEAIETYNKNIEMIKNEINNKYKLLLTEEELKIINL